jgi:hypothetical protein
VGIQENEKNKQEKENNRVGIQEKKNIYTMKEKKIKRKRKTYNERMKQPS